MRTLKNGSSVRTLLICGLFMAGLLAAVSANHQRALMTARSVAELWLQAFKEGRAPSPAAPDSVAESRELEGELGRIRTFEVTRVTCQVLGSPCVVHASAVGDKPAVLTLYLSKDGQGMRVLHVAGKVAGR